MLAELLLKLVDAIERADDLESELVFLGQVIEEAVYYHLGLGEALSGMKTMLEDHRVPHLRPHALGEGTFELHGSMERDLNHHGTPDAS